MLRKILIVVLAASAVAFAAGHEDLAAETQGPGRGMGMMGRSAASSDHFTDSNACALCHSAATTATALWSPTGDDVSPHGTWKATMMANSFRDPYWRAQVSKEVAAASTDEKKAESLDVGWLLFSTEGRINRGQFWGGSLLVAAIDAALGGLLEGLVMAGVITQQVAGFLALPAVFLLVFMKVNVMVKRLHDNGYSGWVSLMAFVPVIGALFLLYLLGFKAGANETNEFGHPPR